MRPRVPMVLVAAALLALAATEALAQAPVSVLSRDGRRPLATSSLNNQDYVAVDDLAPLFGTTAREERLTGGLTIAARSRSIVLTADQNVVSVSGRLVSLPAPVLRRDNRWFVPVDFLPRALALALETRLDYRRPSRLLVVGDLRVPRVVARVDAGTTDVAVTFEISPIVDARIAGAQQGRLTVQFDADAIDVTLPSLPAQTFLIGLAAGDTPTTVSLVTGPRYATYRTSTSQPDGASSRFTVTLLPAATEPAPAPAPPGPPSTDIRTPVPPTAPPASVAPRLRTVVIDPGHGGEETGTQGASGTQEKDITLAVARRLRTLIESRLGLKVYLTRDDDRTVSLDDRSAFANNHQADVFLSIHANASVRQAPKGAEVYYLSVERADEEARKRADDAAVVLPALGGGSRSVDLILWETAQARYMEQSASLAGFIEESLRNQVEMSPRAVQQASLRVLVGANMPAALVEIGYLSNPEQEAQIGSADYQSRVAQALLDALIKFRAYLEP